MAQLLRILDDSMSMHSIPLESLQHVFRFLPPRTLFGRAARVCRFWNSVAKSTFASPEGRVMMRLNAVWRTPDDGRPFAVRETHPFVAFEKVRGGQGRSADHWIAGSITVEGTPLFWAETTLTGGDAQVGEHSVWVLVNPNVDLGQILSNVALVPTSTTFWPPHLENSSPPYPTHEYPHGVQWTRNVEMTAADLFRWSSITSSHSKGINNPGEVRHLTVHYEGLPPNYILFDALALFPLLTMIGIKLRQTSDKVHRGLRMEPFNGSRFLYPTGRITCFRTGFDLESTQRFPDFGWSFLSRITILFPSLTTIGDFALEYIPNFDFLKPGQRQLPKITTVRTSLLGRPMNLFNLSTCKPNHISKSIEAIAATFPSVSELVIAFAAPKTTMWVQDRDTLTSIWRSALDTLPFLEVVRFEGLGLRSVMGSRTSRPAWKSFFEQVGQGRTLFVGHERDADVREPVVDEIS